MLERQVDQQGLVFHFGPATGSREHVEQDHSVHENEFPTDHHEWDNSAIPPAVASGWDHELMGLPSEAADAGCRVVSKLHITPKVDRRKLKAFMVFSKDSRTFVIGSLSNNTHCTLRLEFVYDGYESHFRIVARFDRREDIDHIREKYHRIYFYIPRRSFQDYPVGVEYVGVEDLAQVPAQVQKDVKAQTAHGKNMLYEMAFDYKVIWSVGLMTQFSGRTAEADNALQSLRNIETKNSQVKLYFEAGSRDIEAIEDLMQHLKGEEYMNDKVSRPLRAVHCKKCGGEDHKVTRVATVQTHQIKTQIPPILGDDNHRGGKVEERLSKTREWNTDCYQF
ncbi:hypothetical protein MMC22_002562 [Lobaria immixta]|nr:hypothetical protein [Lobaria immixta]